MSVERWRWCHPAAPWGKPGTKNSEGGPFHACKMVPRIDGGGGGGDGFDEEMTVMEGDVEAIPPHVLLAHERQRKICPKVEGNVVGSLVVGEYV